MSPHQVLAPGRGAGFNSNYQKSTQALAATSTASQRGATDAQIRFAVGECALGAILVALSDKGLCALTLGDNLEALVRDLKDRFPNARLIDDEREFDEIVARVTAFVEQPTRGLDLALDISGTAFEQRVWQALREIPAGETRSYSQLARRIGDAGAARAVARACAANAIAVAIPCHRVVRNDGALSGYRWGVERKRALLEREARS